MEKSYYLSCAQSNLMTNKILKPLLIVIPVFMSFIALAQKEGELGSMLAEIKRAHTPATQVEANFKLATYYFLIDRKAAGILYFHRKL